MSLPDTQIHTVTKLNHSRDHAIPKGSWVLVTGASGYLTTHVINEFLNSGYKIVETARNHENADRTGKLFAQ
jgi:short-subunit dehydrogenase